MLPRHRVRDSDPLVEVELTVATILRLNALVRRGKHTFHIGYSAELYEDEWKLVCAQPRVDDANRWKRWVVIRGRPGVPPSEEAPTVLYHYRLDTRQPRGKIWQLLRDTAIEVANALMGARHDEQEA